MLFLCPEVRLVLAIPDVSLEEIKGMGACTFFFYSEKAPDGPAFKVEVVLAYLTIYEVPWVEPQCHTNFNM